MAFNIAYTYQLIDRYSAPLRKITESTRRHQDMMRRLSSDTRKSANEIGRLTNRTERLNNVFNNLKQTQQSMQRVADARSRAARRESVGGGRMDRFGAAASGLAGLGIGAGGASVMQQTAAVENAMIDLARATDLPAAELAKMQERFMTLSEQIGISTDKLAIMAFEGSKLGLPVDELERFVKLTANTAVAFEIVEDEAGRALGSIKAKMGLSISDIETLMDRVNFVADRTAASGSNMIEIIQRLSGTFKTLKLPPELAAGLAAVADQLETSPELAASGMNMVINRMMKSTTLAKKMVADPAKTIRAVFAQLAEMPEANRIQAAIKMFGDEAGRFAVKMAGNIDLLDDTMQKAADAGALGSMEREMKSRLKSLSMLWKTLSNAVMNVVVTIGEALAPDIKALGESIREVVPKIRDFVKENPGLVKMAAAGVAILGAFALAGPIVMALGAAFSFVGGAIAVLAGPIGAVVAAGAMIALKWKEWTENGHPLVKSLNDIADTVGRVFGKISDLFTKTEGGKRAIDFLSGAFDFLAIMLSTVVDVLDFVITRFEKVLDLASKLSAGNIAEGLKDTAKMYTPWYMEPLLDMAGGSSEQKPATVNGEITVRAEPGTKATVKQAPLPTGSNFVLARDR